MCTAFGVALSVALTIVHTGDILPPEGYPRSPSREGVAGEADGGAGCGVGGVRYRRVRIRAIGARAWGGADHALVGFVRHNRGPTVRRRECW